MTSSSKSHCGQLFFYTPEKAANGSVLSRSTGPFEDKPSTWLKESTPLGRPAPHVVTCSKAGRNNPTGAVRVFPNRNRSKTASFERLGAFVISSRLKNGEVRYVHLVSEKGRPCTLENPWPGKAARITRNGKGAELLEGARLHFRTKENEGNRIAGAAIH